MTTTLQPVHTLYDSIAEMLAPETLSDLLGRPVRHVTCRPFTDSVGLSNHEHFHVEADGHPLVMKRLRQPVDWVTILGNDTRCRSVRLWEYGLLDRLQPKINHRRLAVCREGDEFAILMDDVSAGLREWGEEEGNPGIIYPLLDALAAMHALYWEDETLHDPVLGLSDLETMLTAFWPKHESRIAHVPNLTEITNTGWQVLPGMLAPDVRDSVEALMADPQPLLAALARLPATLLHGDYRMANLALMPETEEVVVFDWQRAAIGPATIDTCWFVLNNHLFLNKDIFFDYYRRRLAAYLGERFDPNLWTAMLHLGCLAEVLHKGCWRAWAAAHASMPEYRENARQTVACYDECVRRGVAWL